MEAIYKKCEKSIDNPRGVIQIDNLSDYDKPFLFCISPQEILDKSVFGTIKEGARAARVRTSDELAGGFKIDEMPFDFLGIKHDFKEDGKTINLVEDFIYPYLKKGNDIKKQARKINFFTYCNAATVYVNIEAKLKEKLLNDGYSDEEVKSILSQISLVSIGSEVNISRINASAILFKDVNDGEVFDNISKVALDKMNLLGRETYVGYYRREDSPAIFTFNGTGAHSLKAYFKIESLAKSSICAVVSMLVENSIKNNSSDNLIPISSKLLLQKAREYSSEFTSSEELLHRLDEEIKYGASRYTKEDDIFLKQLDSAYKLIVKQKSVLEDKERELEKEINNKNLLIDGIHEKCSDVAFQQIVVANGMFGNLRDGKDYSNVPTDRIMRSEYERILGMEEEKGYTL